MEKLLSCDWGTTNFRLRLVDTATAKIITEETSDKGISYTYTQWKDNGADQDTRISFYLGIVNDSIQKIEKRLQVSLDSTPLIISGMASSSIGMIELSYKELPFSIDGSDTAFHTIDETPDCKHRVLIISGVRTDNDVMRGEETQLVGAASSIDTTGKVLFIFPGTHSKHVVVTDHTVTGLKTYMTGEFFELLSKKSVLTLSVEEGNGLTDPANMISFKKGVEDSCLPDLLHTSFLVRTNDLFQKFSKQENYYYLSGLLIGTELQQVKKQSYEKIVLVSNASLAVSYLSAFETLGIQNISQCNADTALIHGHLLLFNPL